MAQASLASKCMTYQPGCWGGKVGLGSASGATIRVLPESEPTSGVCRIKFSMRSLDHTLLGPTPLKVVEV